MLELVVFKLGNFIENFVGQNGLVEGIWSFRCYVMFKKLEGVYYQVKDSRRSREFLHLGLKIHHCELFEQLQNL